jgi:hypothetical protein
MKTSEVKTESLNSNFKFKIKNRLRIDSPKDQDDAGKDTQQRLTKKRNQFKKWKAMSKFFDKAVVKGQDRNRLTRMQQARHRTHQIANRVTKLLPNPN